jgi:ABC-type lipoprotein release transport system permease subunit
VAIFTFFIIIYDKVSGMTSYEQKEIAILKAIGWSIDDILLAKFYEGFIISIFAYLVGVIFALVYVYIFQAPLLSNIFLGFDNIVLKPYLPFVFDIQSLSLVFFISVPIFVASIIFPSWRVATCDTDEILR